MKLKWYDWDGGLNGNTPYFPSIKDIPIGVTHVKQRGVEKVTAPIEYDLTFNECLTFWGKAGFSGDIIAYTLGEHLTISSFLDDPSENKKMFRDGEIFANVADKFVHEPKSKVIKQLEWQIPKPLEGDKK